MNRQPLIACVGFLVVNLLAGCGSLEVFKGKDEPQEVVTRRVVGMKVGDFFQRYGRPTTRSEELDGGAVYEWQSAIETTAPGPNSLDERVCRLRLTADRRGTIVTALVAYDYVGRISTSRCKEMFLPN